MNFIKIAFLILLIITFSACSTTQVNKASNYSYTKVQRVTKGGAKTFHGLVKSQLTSNLSFQTEGKIIFMPYTKGDYVKKGQVLARLDGILYKIRKNEEQAQLNEAIIQYNKSKSNYKRMDILHKEGAISDNDWEDAYFALKTNSQQIQIQKEKINYLDREISYNIITAPFDGYISEKLAEVGSYAKIAEPVLVISGTNKTQVEIMVDESVINKLNINEPVQVNYKDIKYDGKIAHISKTSINQGGYLVKIYLNDLVSKLKDGMSVDVDIALYDTQITYIPLNSVFEQNGQKYVYKIVNIKNNIGEIKKEKIETGQITNEDIEVLSGLKEDELVISKGIDKVKTDTKIQL